MTTGSSFVLHQSICSALKSWQGEEDALTNVHHRFMQMLSIRVMESADVFSGMLPEIDSQAGDILQESMALTHISGDALATEKQLKRVFNVLSNTLSQKGVSDCTDGLMVLGHALSAFSEKQLHDIGNVAHIISRENEFVKKYGGPGISPLKESELMRLYLAGVTHVSINKNTPDGIRLEAQFLKDHGATEVGRFVPSTFGADNDGFSMAEKPVVAGDALLIEFPVKVMDCKLIDTLRDSLSATDDMAANANAFVQALPHTMKSRDVSTASIALYLVTKELCEQGRHQDACTLLGYALHYCDYERAYHLSKCVATLAMQMETDYTVTRGIVGQAQQLAEKMTDARSVFSRRNECVETLNKVVQNPSLSVNVVVALMSKTFNMAGNEVAAWVAHGMTLLPAPERVLQQRQVDGSRLKL